MKEPLMAGTITRKTKTEAKERLKDEQFAGTKKRERASPSHGRKLFYPWPL
jgi:hypothetical protein